MASKYVEKFLEAIDILTTDKVNNAKYDTTVIGIIQQPYNKERGSYMTTINEALREVYGADGYKVGDSVYILNPHGDFSEQLQIIGKRYTGLSTNLQDEAEIDEQYSVNGGNQVKSASEQPLTLTRLNKSYSLISDNIKKEFKAYLNNSVGFKISANFKSSVADMRKLLQDQNFDTYTYGIEIKLKFNKDESKSYIFDINDMTDFPFFYKDGSFQEKIFIIDNAALVGEIEDIILFATLPDGVNITASNIALYCLTDKNSVEGGISIERLDGDSGALFAVTDFPFTPTKIEYKWYVDDPIIEWRELSDTNSIVNINDHLIWRNSATFKCQVIATYKDEADKDKAQSFEATTTIQGNESDFTIEIEKTSISGNIVSQYRLIGKLSCSKQNLPESYKATNLVAKWAMENSEVAENKKANEKKEEEEKITVTFYAFEVDERRLNANTTYYCHVYYDDYYIGKMGYEATKRGFSKETSYYCVTNKKDSSLLPSQNNIGAANDLSNPYGFWWKNSEDTGYNSIYKYLWTFKEVSFVTEQGEDVDITSPYLLSEAGAGIKKIFEFYATADSNSEYPTPIPWIKEVIEDANEESGYSFIWEDNQFNLEDSQDWGLEVPKHFLSTLKKYLWNIQVVLFSDGNIENHAPIVIGAYGDAPIGSSGFGIQLSNDYDLIPADASGTVSENVLLGVNTTIRVFLGTNQQKIYTKDEWDKETDKTNKGYLEITGPDGVGYTSAYQNTSNQSGNNEVVLQVTSLDKNIDNAKINIKFTYGLGELNNNIATNFVEKEFSLTKIKTNVDYWVTPSVSSINLDEALNEIKTITFKVYQKLLSKNNQIFEVTDASQVTLEVEAQGAIVEMSGFTATLNYTEANIDECKDIKVTLKIENIVYDRETIELRYNGHVGDNLAADRFIIEANNVTRNPLTKQGQYGYMYKRNDDSDDVLYIGYDNEKKDSIFKSSTIYTLSFNTTTKIAEFGLFFFSSSISQVPGSEVKMLTKNKGVPGLISQDNRFYAVFQTTKNMKDFKRILLQCKTKEVELWNIKVEEGGFPTDWCPAMENVMQSSINSSFSWDFDASKGARMWKDRQGKGTINGDSNLVFKVGPKEDGTQGNELFIRGHVIAESGQIGSVAIGNVASKDDVTQGQKTRNLMANTSIERTVSSDNTIMNYYQATDGNLKPGNTYLLSFEGKFFDDGVDENNIAIGYYLNLFYDNVNGTDTGNYYYLTEINRIGNDAEYHLYTAKIKIPTTAKHQVEYKIPNTGLYIGIYAKKRGSQVIRYKKSIKNLKITESLTYSDWTIAPEEDEEKIRPNLIKQSNELKKKSVDLQKGTIKPLFDYSLAKKLTKGEQYTLTIKGTYSPKVRFRAFYNRVQGDPSIVLQYDQRNNLHYATFILEKESQDESSVLNIWGTSTNSELTQFIITLSQIKLEKGPYRTPWRDISVNSNEIGDYSWSFDPEQGIMMWNGSQTDEHLMFTVNSDGAYIDGRIVAKKGLIGNLEILDGALMVPNTDRGITINPNDGSVMVQNLEVQGELSISRFKTSQIQGQGNTYINFDTTDNSIQEFSVTYYASSPVLNEDRTQYTVYVYAIVTDESALSLPNLALSKTQHITIDYFYSFDKAGMQDIKYSSTVTFNKGEKFQKTTEGGKTQRIIVNTVTFDSTIIRPNAIGTYDRCNIPNSFSVSNEYIVSGNTIIKCHGNFVPTLGQSFTLGTQDNRWSYVWLDQSYQTTMAIDDSDRNLKNSIISLSDQDQQLNLFFDRIEPVSYKFNKNTSNRTHFGFIAQDIEQALLDSDLTTQDFAGVCKWEDEELEDGYRYGLRYGEFIPLNTWQIQKLKTRVAELEEKILMLTSAQPKEE